MPSDREEWHPDGGATLSLPFEPGNSVLLRRHSWSTVLDARRFPRFFIPVAARPDARRPRWFSNKISRKRRITGTLGVHMALDVVCPTVTGPATPSHKLRI